MAFLSEEQLGSLRIERMIFHVVGPEPEQLVLLEEMEPGLHADFFLDRIRSTNGGMMFDFVESSTLLLKLRVIEADASQFTVCTQHLAEAFKLVHGRNASAGVFMVFTLSAAEQRFYALVKYDHETVLAYKIEETPEGRKAAIAALHDTFVKAPDALQKSAIVRLSDEGGELCIRDRSAPTRGSKYFTAFLGARRRFESIQLTKKLCEIAKSVARGNSKILAPDVLRNLNRRIYEVVQTSDGFDPANKEPFLAAVYGPLPADSKVRLDFDRALKSERIDSESFDFERSAIARPVKQHIVTDEGIEVIWDRQYDDKIRRKDLPGGGTRITIETSGVRVDDDYAESRPRGR